MADARLEIDLKVDLGFNDIRTSLRSASRAASIAVAKQLLADSRPFVPVLTGVLLDTGRVEVIDDPLGVADIVRVVYGSNEAVYAQLQHDEEFNHPSLGFFGAAQYLLKPYQLNIGYYLLLWELEFEDALGGLLTP